MSDDATITPVLSTAQSRWHRNLRISVSVFFGLLTVALCVLWVRSYWRTDGISRVGAWIGTVQSSYGYVMLFYMPKNEQVLYIGPTADWWISGNRTSGMVPNRLFHSTSSRTTVAVPHLFLIVPSTVIAIAAFPASLFSFSLRALLIATTLIAVMLGLGVWLAS